MDHHIENNEALAPDALFIAVVWLIPVILCTDWSRLRGTKREQE